MRYSFLLGFLLMMQQLTMAQKKPLDHSVYDSWQSIGQKLISNDGKWVVYTIDPQEGDNQLVIQSAASDTNYKKIIARGYNALITEDSRYLIFRIKPFYKEIREADIKKKKADEMPKDSLGIVELGKDSVWKAAEINGYRVPEKGSGWLVYQLAKAKDASKSKVLNGEAKRIADSLTRIIDSLQALLPKRKVKQKDDITTDSRIDLQDSTLQQDADDNDNLPASAVSQFDIRLRNLNTGQEKTFKNVIEYLFSKKGQKILIEQFRNGQDSLLRKRMVILFDLRKGFADTLSNGGNDFRNFTMTDDGSQVAYLAERDAKPKDLEKYYKVWYFKEGMDSATVLVDKNSVGMKLGMTISENGIPGFSKSGRRLFFGTAPIQAPEDTSLVDIDLAKLDIWHYNDDYLQTVQLSRLSSDEKRNYLAVYDFENNSIQQLGAEDIPTIYQTNEGDGDVFYGVTDAGKTIESQWMGSTKKDIYAIHVKEGTKKLIKENLEGIITQSYVSPTGKYVIWYDSKAKNYFVYDGDSIKNITTKIKVPLYDEEHDTPGNPSPYGVMGWHEGDSAVYIYDRYDVWRVNPTGKPDPFALTSPARLGFGRAQKNSFRYIKTDPDELFLKTGQALYFRMTNLSNKKSAIVAITAEGLVSYPQLITDISDHWYSAFAKAKNSQSFIYTRENFFNSPDIYFATAIGIDINLVQGWHIGGLPFVKLSSINPQQKEYNWGTAELYKWKTFKGKPSEGILYKPENFDPAKKYPLILYFYEKLSDGLNTYHPPSPTASRLNISFFVSRGYLVFAPDISYTIGHPAQSAYDYIASAAKDLAKYRWVDAKNIGIQGQSWGGIQVAQLITMTDMFKAAWAGAPVANMTSAYGGIRWESGANRQFQYEKTQSRIGATLWEKPELYIENSPLFHLPKIKTPLVIMANDADGAVPWYQGIELFTGMRRLGKKVWMLNYNGEAHNLVQRKNRKDIQIRQQQFFDWLLKGEKPAKWITEGVPAVKKGKDWGLELVD